MIETALVLLARPVFAAILALAIYSITRLIVTDSFPPIEKLRTKFFEHFPHDGFSTLKRPIRGEWVSVGRSYLVNIGTWQGELVSCPWCAGWWVSLAVSTLFLFWPTIVLACCVPFALRVIPGIIQSILD